MRYARLVDKPHAATSKQNTCWAARTYNHRHARCLAEVGRPERQRTEHLPHRGSSKERLE